jgi:hypothetical protein
MMGPMSKVLGIMVFQPILLTVKGVTVIGERLVESKLLEWL